MSADKELGQAVHLLGCEAAAELGRAVLKHKPFNSLHEGYGVICEELAEFFDEVRAWQPTTRDYSKARKELIQVAAVALRTVLDVCDAPPDDPPPPPIGLSGHLMFPDAPAPPSVGRAD